MNIPDLSEKMLIAMHKTDVKVTAMMGNRCLRFMECFLSILYLTASLPCSGLVVHLAPPLFDKRCRLETKMVIICCVNKPFWKLPDTH